MKRLDIAIIFLTFAWPVALQADDVIPSVSKEEMSAYKSAFGKAISDSRRAEGRKPEKAEEIGQMAQDPAPKGDKFGGRVSDAARNLKTEIQKDNKNFGAWVSKQRSERPDDAGSTSKGNSDSAKASTASGRPKGKSEDGKKNKGGGHGKKN